MGFNELKWNDAIYALCSDGWYEGIALSFNSTSFYYNTPYQSVIEYAPGTNTSQSTLSPNTIMSPAIDQVVLRCVALFAWIMPLVDGSMSCWWWQYCSYSRKIDRSWSVFIVLDMWQDNRNTNPKFIPVSLWDKREWTNLMARSKWRPD